MVVSIESKKRLQTFVVLQTDVKNELDGRNHKYGGAGRSKGVKGVRCVMNATQKRRDVF